MYYKTNYLSPVGNLTLAGDNKSLIGLWLDGQKHHGSGIAKELIQKDDLPVFTAAKNWLDRYFAGENPAPSELSLSPIGGAFRQNVWQILCAIPYGEVMTYGDIAEKVTTKMNKAGMSSQAVGGAVGHNPISIIIPCHRVVGSGGRLTGYAGGLDAKSKLLELEGVDLSAIGGKHKLAIWGVKPDRTI